MEIPSFISNSDYVSAFRKPEPFKYSGTDFPTGFVITILDQNFKALPNPIQLSGTRMPHQPFEWEMKQRTKKTMYAGNDEPTIQVLGVEYSDQVIKGAFVDRKYQVDTSKIGTTSQQNLSIGYVNTLEELMKSRQAVCVSMDDKFQANPDFLRFRYVRFGYIKNVKFRMTRVTEIEYEITFEWFGEKVPFTNFFLKNADVSDLLSDASKLASATHYLDVSVGNSPLSTLDSVYNDIKNGIAAVKSAIATVTKAIEQITQFTKDLSSAIKNLMGIFDNVFSAISNFKYALTGLVTTVSKIPDKASQIIGYAKIAATSSLLLKPTGSTSATAKDMIPYFVSASNQNNAAVQQNSTATMEAILSRMKTQAIASVKALLPSSYICMAGDTLPLVSRKIYKDASRWPQILVYNQLNSTVLTEGQVLKIPRPKS